MKNIEIAEILFELADIYEMQNVPWKPIALRKAARVIETLTEEVEEIYKKGGTEALEKIPGVGAGIARRIEELLTTGKLKEYETAIKAIPRGVEEIMHLMGIGPKKAIRLYKELGIASIKELEAAAKAGKIRTLRGFGPKSEEDILKALELKRIGEKRITLGVALPIAREIQKRLLSITGVTKAVPSGSLRRMRETVGDIDTLVIAKDSKKVMDYFTTMPEVIRVLAKGPTKSMVMLQFGPYQIQADVRVLSEKSFGAALQYFTGSKDHNIKLRQLAIKKGYKLSEYGLFETKTNRQIAGRSEEEIYSKLGLPYIEPELRENLGEIEAAQENRLPDLIGYEAIKGDLQVHTNWSDGNNSLEEMVSACQKLGYAYIAITDHSKRQKVAHGMDEKRILKQIKEIEKIRKKFEIEILIGSEVDILPNGDLDYRNAILKKLDFVLASVHSKFKSPKEEMTRRICKALENPYVKCFAHPTGRIINVRPPYEVDLEKVGQVAKDRDIALEINAYPDRLDLKDSHIKMLKEIGVKFLINTDSHAVDHLKYIEYGIAQARRGWATSSDILNSLPWKKFEKWLTNK